MQGVLDRFGQIEPKLFIACEGYRFNDKGHSVAAKIADVLTQLPSVEHAILVAGLDGTTGTEESIDKAVSWESAVESQDGGEPEFLPLAFDDPLYILFSSGTTGVPKCIVHGAGGALLQHVKEQQLHCGLVPGERLFYFTTCGWMMWNWLVSGLASGSTLVLYEGSPVHAQGKTLFDVAQEEEISVFGTSAKFIDAVFKAGFAARRNT